MNAFLVRWIKLTLVAIVGCGFIAMLIYALVNRDAIRNSQVEPPLISPPDQPLKRRPDQPGGMQIPNRDKLVFDLLDNNVSSATPAADRQDMEENDVSGDTAVSGSEVMAMVSSTAAVEASAPAAPSPTVEAKPVDVTPKPEPAVVVKPAEKVAPVVAAKTPVTAAGWGVQVAAVNTKTDGDKVAARLQKSLGALSGLAARIEATPDGKHYRVQFGGLKSHDEASAVCAKLKAAKQPCFPVKIP